jgi:HK97 family phage portal protein
VAVFNFIDSLWTRFGWNSDRFYKQTQGYWVEEVGNTSPIHIDTVELERIYLQIPQLRAIIDLRAQMLTASEWKLYDKQGNNIPTSPLLDLLEQPNPLQSGDDFLANLSIQEDINGNAFVNINKGRFGLPKSMYVLPNKGAEILLTGKVFRQTDLDGIIKGYRFLYNNIDDTFTPNEIIHFKQSDSGLILGKSKVETLVREISNIKAAMDSRNVMITQRGAIGMIVPDAKDSGTLLTPDEKKAMELKNQEVYGIGKDQRRVKFMSQPVKWIPTVIDTKSLMLFEEIETNFNVMCDAYGLKSELFSKVKGSTFNNYEMALKATYQNTIIPRAKTIASKMTKRLCENGQYLELAYNIPILQDDLLSQRQGEKQTAEVLRMLADMDMTYEELINIINENQSAAN